MNNEILLDTKLVGDIEGDFFVPSYQRGYRWGKAEVNRLLDDIYATEGKINYCLQPVVVRKSGDMYELIDGQQRLTTIYLIYRYMYDASGHFLNEPKFTISYATREKSEDFLQSIDINRKEDNIDFWFICDAYENIKNWFEAKDKKSALTNMNKYFDEIVKIIWYEVNETENAISMFTRLNIGKIPLTSAELVKAMFLSKDSVAHIDRENHDVIEKQYEISLQWDNIEKELHNDALWYFLTNKTDAEYPTRIDLVLDLISRKQENNREKYYTFFDFDKKRQDPTLHLDDIWNEIQLTFLTLKDWFENHELYHKVGYLIASDYKTLLEIYRVSQDKTKDEFKSLLDDYIKESVATQGSYSDLSYESDQKEISTLLLLFNIESVRQSDEQTQRFPFDKFKFGKNGKVMWSLEHIHAQQSERMRTQEVWKEWLNLHIPSVKAVSANSDELITEMEAAIKKERLQGGEFNSIQEKVIDLLSVKGNAVSPHSISNMALLKSSDNAALNNSTFDVKRNEIIKMDKKGQYIPFCTRMVFLKYYTPSESNQLHFWGQADREAYVAEMNRVLKDYLQEPIEISKEEK